MTARHQLDHLMRSSDLRLLVAIGALPGVTELHKFGRDGTATTTEDIIGVGVTRDEVLPASAGVSRVRVQAGGNAADTVAGAGARRVLVSGLDDTFAEVSEVLELAGASASAYTTADFRRLNRAFVTEVGTYNGKAAADITIEDESGNTRCVITSGLGQTQLCYYTVPAGKTMLLLKSFIRVETGKSATVRMYQRWHNDGETKHFAPRLVTEWPMVTGGTQESSEHATWEVYPERSDIYMTAQAASGTARVNAEFEAFIYDNELWTDVAAIAAALPGS